MKTMPVRTTEAVECPYGTELPISIGVNGKAIIIILLVSCHLRKTDAGRR